jgi:uncharacterized protein
MIRVRFELLIVGSILFLTVGLAVGSAQDQRITTRDIQSPRPDGWIVDLTATVSPEAVEYINLVCDEVHQRLKREMCVVVISTTGGRDNREFGTELFNLWSVGSAGLPGAPGVWRNNGILLLAAIDDRRASIVLGDGIDGPEETRLATQIIDDVVIPNFRDGDQDSALYEGIRSCATRIFSVADLDSPAVLPSRSPRGQAPQKIRRHRQRGPITWFPWILGGGLIGTIGWLIGRRYYLRYRPRRCPSCSQEMIRLREDQDDEFLDDPEQVEEQLGSVDYDVWACLNCDEVLKIRYGKWWTRYSRCPECRYVTVYKIENVLVGATYHHGGKVRVVETCKNCDYHRRYTYRTPMKVRPSSSSGSFGSGGSSGGGSSSGFSGGSSSGGGASGGW